MMKFFRKYNKQMLAVFAALLLIVWLAGDALQYFLNPDASGQVWASSAFGDITNAERQEADQQTTWMNRLNLPWQIPLGQVHEQPLDLASWILLTREAHQMGIRSSRPVARNMLRLSDDAVLRMAQQANVKTDVIYDSAAAFADVWRYLQKMSRATNVNEAELRKSAFDMLNKVQVKAAVLPARMFVEPDATFSDSEIQEQFDKYKDKKRSGEGLNFGYMLPARVKVQYFKIEPAKLVDRIPDSERLIRDARKYWSENKEKDPAFKRPATQPDAASQPVEAASQPASQPEYFTRWDEAKEGALRAKRKEYAAKEAREIVEWLMMRSTEAWSSVERKPDEYPPAPEAVRDAGYYERMIQGAPATVLGADTVTVQTTDWVSPESISKLPGIGGAWASNPSGGPLSFSQLAFRVQGLVPYPKGEDLEGIDLNTFLALHQTSRLTLEDNEGSLYVFRVIESDAERAPRELAEVREQVIEDLRLARAYEKATAAAEELKNRAAADGLAAAWDASPELKQKAEEFNSNGAESGVEAGLQEPQPFARRGFGSPEPLKFVPKVGPVSEEFVEASFALGGADVAEPRIKSVAMPDSGSVTVIEWVKNVPADQNQFAMMKGFLSTQLQQRRQEEYLSNWMAPQQVRARNRFEIKSAG